jgi:hypothetical protein
MGKGTINLFKKISDNGIKLVIEILHKLKGGGMMNCKFAFFTGQVSGIRVQA